MKFKENNIIDKLRDIHQQHKCNPERRLKNPGEFRLMLKTEIETERLRDRK